MTRLLLDERIRADGEPSRTWGLVDGDYLNIVDDDGTHGRLSFAAIGRVMTRYGRELDDTIRLDGEAITLGECRLRRLRHHAQVDAEARDYLVWEEPGAAPVAALATHVAAALRYLVLRLVGEKPQETEDPGA